MYKRRWDRKSDLNLVKKTTEITGLLSQQRGVQLKYYSSITSIGLNISLKAQTTFHRIARPVTIHLEVYF